MRYLYSAFLHSTLHVFLWLLNYCLLYFLGYQSKGNVFVPNLTKMKPSKIDKIRKLLQLCFLQANIAINTNEKDVDNLVNHFTRLVDIEQVLRKKMEEGVDCNDDMQELRMLISSIITDFQFFDRLKQQITSAVDPIKTWTENGDLPDPFQPDFVQRYTTQEEKDIYHLAIAEDSIEIVEQQVAMLQNDKVEHDDDALLF